MAGYLIDTHLLLWSMLEPQRLSRSSADLLRDRSVAVAFSLVTIWEVAIKASLRKPGFEVDPTALRTALLDEGYAELPLASAHIAHVVTLPLLHRDPFDRMLVAQAAVEGLSLLTADATLKRYGRFVRAV